MGTQKCLSDALQINAMLSAIALPVLSYRQAKKHLILAEGSVKSVYTLKIATERNYYTSQLQIGGAIYITYFLLLRKKQML